MMENQVKEQKLESQVGEGKKAKPFPILKLPTELQLQILSCVLAHDKPIVVLGFTSTYSFGLPPPTPTPTKSKIDSTCLASARRWNHLPFSIMLTSKHMHELCESLLFASHINTFAFTTPPSRQWSYGRDWYWTFSFGALDHSKGTSAAMKCMSRVLFKCDGSMDNSLVGTAVEYLPRMEILTVDFKDFWGSPSAKLEEEGRRNSGLGGFGGHVVLPDRNQTKTPVYSAVEGVGEVCCVQSNPTSQMMTSMTPSTTEMGHDGWDKLRDRYGSAFVCSKRFVSVVWKDVVVTSTGRVLKELRFSGLKVGKGNWDEVVGYGERIAGRKGVVGADMEDGSE